MHMCITCLQYHPSNADVHAKRTIVTTHVTVYASCVSCTPHACAHSRHVPLFLVAFHAILFKKWSKWFQTHVNQPLQHRPNRAMLNGAVHTARRCRLMPARGFSGRRCLVP